MVMRDFRDNNLYLIMLRPNPDVLKSIQSLSYKPIVTAKDEIDLITILKELANATQFNQNINVRAEFPNCKIISETTDEIITTKL